MKVEAESADGWMVWRGRGTESQVLDPGDLPHPREAAGHQRGELAQGPRQLAGCVGDLDQAQHFDALRDLR